MALSGDSLGAFNQLPTDDEIIKKFRPEYITQGGEHLVYRIPDHADVVVKASKHKIVNIICSHYTENNVPTNQRLSQRVTEEYKSEVDQKNQELRRLRAFFGNEHTLPEKRFLMKIPISREILEELFKNDYKKRNLPESARQLPEVWSHVIVQKFTPLVADPDHLSFSFGRLCEDRQIDSGLYDEITSALLDDKDSPVSKERFFDLQDSSREKYLQTAITKAQQDDGLRTAVFDFLRKTVEFSHITGQILALGGHDNVIFYRKDDGRWDYLLIDAIIPIPEPILQSTVEGIAQKIARGEALSVAERRNLQRCLNFTRVINGAISILGGLGRIEMPNVLRKPGLLKIIRDDTTTEHAASVELLQKENLEKSSKYLSKDYFDIQIKFAEAVAEKTGIPLNKVLFTHTNFYRRFGLGSVSTTDESNLLWQDYIRRLSNPDNENSIEDYTYDFYLNSPVEKPRPKLTFGCFSCDPIDKTGVVYLHFSNTDTDGQSPLAADKLAIRKKELRDMFVHIKREYHDAKIVRSGSWLHSLEVYRSLFPPAYNDSRTPMPPPPRIKGILIGDSFYDMTARCERILRQGFLSS